MEAEREFWEHVQNDTAPLVDGSDSTSDTISTLFPESNTDIVNLFAYDSSLQQYMALTAQIKELEAIKDEVSNKIKAFLGDAGKGESDKYKVSWTSAERKTFDTKRFEKDHADMDLSEYYKKSSYRTFKVSEK